MKLSTGRIKWYVVGENHDMYEIHLDGQILFGAMNLDEFMAAYNALSRELRAQIRSY